jgi:hypothetical protein
MKKCSALLVNWIIKIKSTMRNHITSARGDNLSFKMKISNLSRYVEKMESLSVAGGNAEITVKNSLKS